MKKLMIFSAMAATGLAAPAMAQDATDHAGHAMDAETAEAPATAPQTAAPMAEGEAMAATPVTEAEVDSFAAAIGKAYDEPAAAAAAAAAAVPASPLSLSSSSRGAKNSDDFSDGRRGGGGGPPRPGSSL